ncbi:MAG: hypothetical protein OXM54_02465 [Acidimicrobiaceae bacterium]|nr:hypothetical protein [Acidimicrobiaceae bacterium]MDE0318532.1 hypothetical protein [Acidimicrobiaceae bacterium]
MSATDLRPAASTLSVDLVVVPIRDDDEISREVEYDVPSSNLIVTRTVTSATLALENLAVS